MHFSYEEYEGFSKPLEGRVPGMYCDILGLITCAVGNLIDTRTAGTYPTALVEAIRWTLADGSRAPLDAVRADWWKLKQNAAHYAKLHWKYALAATKCRLSEEEIDRIVKERLAINEAEMRKAFADWDTWPADAQLVVMSMCWAVGTGWLQKFPRFARLVKAQDWAAAAAFDDPKNPKGNWPGKIREAGNPGVVPRNLKNRFCLLNAATVKAYNLPPTKLWWPEAAPVDDFEVAGKAVAEAKAEAELQLAAWQALEVCPYQSPLGGRAMLDDEATP
jgi:GH24 family phage-related lysozyme (muramidase)